MIRITYLKDYYNPISVSKDSTRIAFDYEPIYDIDEEGNKKELKVATWSEHVFKNKPTLSQIKEFILNEINKRIDNEILTGFIWNNMNVWLSTENQFNYKAAFDLAVQTQGKSLPVTFKFGDTDNPQYHTFETVEDITDFYTKAMSYVNSVLAKGWQKKDSIDWSVYEDPQIEPIKL